MKRARALTALTRRRTATPHTARNVPVGAAEAANTAVPSLPVSAFTHRWFAASAAPTETAEAAEGWAGGARGVLAVGAGSGLLDEFGLELHRAEAVDLAVDVVVAVDQADVLDLGADLHHRG